jgi:hypothetical protein
MFSLDEYFFFNNTKKKKNIKFNYKINVILIPNRSFYEKHNLIESLWWSSNELNDFKKESYTEIKKLMERHYFMSIKQASKLLYQPGSMTIVYDKDNFEDNFYNYQ